MMKAQLLQLLLLTLFIKGAEGNFKEKYGVTENQKYKKEITAVGLSITKKF